MINKKLYRKLIETAKAKTTIYYEEVADICGLNLSQPDDREIELCKILDEINKYEDKRKRHMLTAVVVLKNKQPIISGDGFFDLAYDLGIMEKGEDHQLFHAKELGKVHDYWEENEIPEEMI